MPYTIAFPPLHAAPSSPAPVIPVTEPRMVPPPAAVTQPQDSLFSESSQLGSRFLEMTLAEFETQDHALQVRVPWLPESLWFVPSSAKATILSQEGISRGRIWTAKELRNLLEVGEVTPEALRTLTQIKQEFGAEFTRFRRTKEPYEDHYESQATPTGLESLWPLEITGMGKSTVGSFTPCERCGEGTWTSYGGVPFCRRHAMAEATRRKAADDPT
jgi:hypothetical protein